MKHFRKSKTGPLKKRTGNVIRIYGEISSYLNQPEKENDPDKPVVKKKTRKELRKEGRQSKKSKKHAYFSRLPAEKDDNDKTKEANEIVNDPEEEEQEVKKKKKRNKKEKPLSKTEYIRKKNNEEAIKEDEKEIKKLEKQMKLNKRKSKSLPKSFILDGMDYLLDFCDTEKRASLQEAELSDDDQTDFQDDLNDVLGTKSAKRKLSVSDDEAPTEVPIESRSKKRVKWKDLDGSDNEEVIDEEPDADDSEDAISDNKSDDDSEDEDEQDEIDANESEDGLKNDDSDVDMDDNDESPKKDVWEDIYGRLRDKDGQVIQKKDEQRYVPPAQRLKSAEDDPKKREILNRIKRQLKGYLNKLSESNMQHMTNQIEDMYMRQSRHDMNVTLIELLIQSCVSPALTPERLVSEHAMLVAILHANIGTEVGAQVVQMVIDRVMKLIEDAGYGESKECNNLLLLIAYIYNFKVIHCTLIYDLINKLAEVFKEKEIELILLLLRTVGFTLRKDDPLLLKEVITNLQTKGATVTTLEDQNRVRFMLDTLMALKNNNMSKIPNYDPSKMEHMRKNCRGIIRKGSYISELRVTLKDLLNVKERGRWWIVGSAWSGEIDSANNTKDKEKVEPFKMDGNVSGEILQLAHKQRMNTDVRRNIFCILMTAEDFVDAFEKLLKLGLKNQPEREIIHVAFNCCLQEQKFNPFYSLIIQKFCEYDRRFQMTTQCAIWDKLKESDKISKVAWSNLAQLLSKLIMTKALSISVLKVVQFSDLNKKFVRLLRQVLLAILLHESDTICQEVFSRTARSENLKDFKEGLKLFIRHFILRNKETLTSENLVQKLHERCKIVEAALTSSESRTKL